MPRISFFPLFPTGTILGRAVVEVGFVFFFFFGFFFLDLAALVPRGTFLLIDILFCRSIITDGLKFFERLRAVDFDGTFLSFFGVQLDMATVSFPPKS